MKNDQNISGFEAFQQTFQTFASLRATIGENWVRFWLSQDKIIDGMQEFAAGWFERRHQATLTALEAAQRSCEANSPAEVMQEFQTWAMGSLQRIAEDGRACQRHFASLAELPAQPAAGQTESSARAPAREKPQVEPTMHPKAA